MNRHLRSLAAEHQLDTDDHDDLRLRFAVQCANRTRHLLEDPDIIRLLDLATGYPTHATREAIEAAAQEAAAIARSHPGSSSIDGTGHAAVSATFGVARALAADAWNAAEYAAYALTYAYSGSAVTDPAEFDAEYQFQCRLLQRMLAEKPITL